MTDAEKIAALVEALKEALGWGNTKPSRGEWVEMAMTALASFGEYDPNSATFKEVPPHD